VSPFPARQLNQDFLRTCVPFDDGGDYDVSEVAICRESLRGLEVTFEAAAGERATQLGALEALCASTADLFGDAFNKSVEACLEVGGGVGWFGARAWLWVKRGKCASAWACEGEAGRRPYGVVATLATGWAGARTPLPTSLPNVCCRGLPASEFGPCGKRSAAHTFVNSVLTSLRGLLRCDHHITTPYAPWSNGSMQTAGAAHPLTRPPHPPCERPVVSVVAHVPASTRLPGRPCALTFPLPSPCTGRQSLSMELGMGKKYGEPRRSAQELIRSECTWSDEAEAAITARLDELAALTAAAPGAVPPVPIAGDTVLVTPESALNQRVQVCIGGDAGCAGVRCACAGGRTGCARQQGVCTRDLVHRSCRLRPSWGACVGRPLAPSNLHRPPPPLVTHALTCSAFPCGIRCDVCVAPPPSLWTGVRGAAARHDVPACVLP
jgi:hypothetical protein